MRSRARQCLRRSCPRWVSPDQPSRSAARIVRCRVGMSLSPRPESPMRIRLPGLPCAQLRAPAKACADSSAGRMPSARQHSPSAVERLVVADRLVAHAADGLEQRVLGTDARIVEPGGDRMRLLDLAVRRPAAAASSSPAARRACRRRAMRRSRPSPPPVPPASTPSRATSASPTNGWKSPIAFEPPPTQATAASGRAPVCSSICARASRPITDCNSRTRYG